MQTPDQSPIHRLPTPRDDFVALEITGHFAAADLQQAYGWLAEVYARHARIDLLVKIAHFGGFDWGAVFDESTMYGKVKALSRVRRYAVVGGPSWMRVMLGIFSPLTPIEARHFPAEDEAKAWAWLAEEPVAVEPAI